MQKHSISFVLSSCCLFAALLVSSCGGDAGQPAPGATLYTVRNLMDEDPKGTLKQVADIGYVNIEGTNYADGKFYGMEPEEFRDFVTISTAAVQAGCSPGPLPRPLRTGFNQLNVI